MKLDIYIILDLCICFMQLTDDRDVVVLNVLSLYIGSCIWGISQTDVQTVQWTIQTFSFSAVITSIYSVEITNIINSVSLVVCPGQPMCLGHGSCDDAVCICDLGMNFSSVTHSCCSFLILQVLHILE